VKFGGFPLDCFVLCLRQVAKATGNHALGVIRPCSDLEVLGRTFVRVRLFSTQLDLLVLLFFQYLFCSFDSRTFVQIRITPSPAKVFKQGFLIGAPKAWS